MYTIARERMRVRAVRRLLVEQGNEHGLVQLGTDEAQRDVVGSSDVGFPG
jgi:hypothetical protein